MFSLKLQSIYSPFDLSDHSNVPVYFHYLYIHTTKWRQKKPTPPNSVGFVNISNTYTIEQIQTKNNTIKKNWSKYMKFTFNIWFVCWICEDFNQVTLKVIWNLNFLDKYLISNFILIILFSEGLIKASFGFLFYFLCFFLRLIDKSRNAVIPVTYIYLNNFFIVLQSFEWSPGCMKEVKFMRENPWVDTIARKKPDSKTKRTKNERDGKLPPV